MKRWENSMVFWWTEPKRCLSQYSDYMVPFEFPAIVELYPIWKSRGKQELKLIWMKAEQPEIHEHSEKKKTNWKWKWKCSWIFHLKISRKCFFVRLIFKLIHSIIHIQFKKRKSRKIGFAGMCGGITWSEIKIVYHFFP